MIASSHLTFYTPAINHKIRTALKKRKLILTVSLLYNHIIISMTSHSLSEHNQHVFDSLDAAVSQLPLNLKQF